MLIGAGYDAYVISGYATKETCLADESRDICPLLKKKEEVRSCAAGIYCIYIQKIYMLQPMSLVVDCVDYNIYSFPRLKKRLKRRR